MQAHDIKVGQTYIGAVSFKDGIGSHRTVIDVSDDLVMFRCEVGKNPPDCFVRNANMEISEFAMWAKDVVQQSTVAN